MSESNTTGFYSADYRWIYEEKREDADFADIELYVELETELNELEQEYKEHCREWMLYHNKQEEQLKEARELLRAVKYTHGKVRALGDNVIMENIEQFLERTSDD